MSETCKIPKIPIVRYPPGFNSQLQGSQSVEGIITNNEHRVAIIQHQAHLQNIY